MTAPEPPRVRLSDGDRDRAAARLQLAVAEGRIDLTELDERLAVVYAARFPVDLAPVFEDLPGGLDAAQAPVAAAPVPALVDVEPTVLSTGWRTLKREGAWTTPARLLVRSTAGSVVLDYREAVVPYPVVEIEVQLGIGALTLVVPDGATANLAGVVGTTSVGRDIRSMPRAGSPHFVVHGRAGSGWVIVKHARRRRS